MHKSDYKDLVSSVFLALFSGVGASFLFAVIALLLSQPASADKVAVTDHSGTLHVRTVSGLTIRHVPRLKTDVSMQISGMLARVKVKQRFINPSPEWVEAVYVFPLPEDSAVDHMRMLVAGRVIEGEIKEKAKARRLYEQAKLEGKRASLLDQQRPNIFTTSLANIPPGEEILVEIEYQQAVHQREGLFSLRFPMVIGPRYIPGTPIHDETTDFNSRGWAMATDEVPDAGLISPPVLDKDEHRKNRVNMQIDLNSGIALAWVKSLYHEVHADEIAEGHQRLRLKEGEMKADRDFVLQWRLHDSVKPAAALFQQKWQDKHYSLLMVSPPATTPEDTQQPARELILVVDTSGSMQGESIEQAQAALMLALQGLKAKDSFNVIRFSHEMDTLFEHAVPASAVNLKRARRYVEALQADGGTEMEPAMRYALDSRHGKEKLRQVVFLTDGDIGNEEALFATIQRFLGESRLFPVGIGSAPNSFFMRRAAEFGRGSFTYIGDLADVEVQMQGLFARLQSPVLTNIQLRWKGESQQVQAPNRVPDLYSGEPLLVALQGEHAAESVTIEGMLGNRPWRREIRLHGGASSAGVHVLWARRMIADWMARRSLGEDADRVRSEVLEIALDHHLVSAYTSLVAVDKIPVRSAEDALHSKAVAGHLPKGWNQSKLSGSMPQTATPSQLLIYLGLLILLTSFTLYRWRRA